MKKSVISLLCSAFMMSLLLGWVAAKSVANFQSKEDEKISGRRIDLHVDEVSRFDPVGELGVPVPTSLFTQSFALRRIAPLEYKAPTNADGVPIYTSKETRQKRGGSVGYGGIYPIQGDFQQEHIEHQPLVGRDGIFEGQAFNDDIEYHHDDDNDYNHRGFDDHYNNAGFNYDYDNSQHDYNDSGDYGHYDGGDYGNFGSDYDGFGGFDNDYNHY